MLGRFSPTLAELCQGSGDHGMSSVNRNTTPDHDNQRVGRLKLTVMLDT